MNIKTNSKHVKKNDIFICIHDEIEDRHKYIKDIKYASAIIVDKDIDYNTKIPLIKVNDTNDTLFDIYNKYYDNPLINLNLIGITGTDGKTTTSMIIKMLLNSYSETAYLGTNGFIYDRKSIKTCNTTPPINLILKYAKILERENINNLVMEVSSEGLVHNRCNNLKFKRVLITNVTSDHLNVHKTFDNYLKSKFKILDLLENDGIAIFNTDDVSYSFAKNKNIRMLTYGINEGDFLIKNIEEYEDKTSFILTFKDKEYQIVSPLLGKFNVYNLVGAIVCLYSFGIDLEDIIKNISNLKAVSGRVNVFDTKCGAKIILDYAHTSNAVNEILNYARKIRKGRIITVIGSAGGRDTDKRKDIGKIVTSLSDIVIFTMDDPRFEKVEDINNDLIKNVKISNYIFITNRKKAIKYALNMGKKDDLILILGKGTDNYMAIKNKYKKYSDLKTIKKYI